MAQHHPETEPEPEQAAIFAWREDAAQLLHDARESVVAEWHQYGTREQAVEDLTAYLLAAWTQAGETTASLLLPPPSPVVHEDDAATRAALAAISDPRAGQLWLARLVAESAAAEVLAAVPARSYDDVPAAMEPDLDAETEARIEAALAWIDAANATLAGQRTAAWHQARAQLFSASTIHKLLSTPAQFNALVYEKCLAMWRRARQGEKQQQQQQQDVGGGVVVAMPPPPPPPPEDDAGPRPLRYKPRASGAAPMQRIITTGTGDDGDECWTPPVFRRVLDARNWGTKMEPLSAAFYCYRNRSAAGIEPELRTDLGCLPHRTHAFLGASPDGVVVGPRGHPRRGCNVEIKNIVDRPITGDPKPEHYAQFQLQMEVCDLPRTDFLETRFCEYEFPEDYFLRQRLRPDLPHGLVLHFAPPGGGGGGWRRGASCAWGDEDEDVSAVAVVQPKAEWAYSRPGQLLRTREEVDAWIAEECLARRGLELDETAYWVLEEYSCVRSDRNHEWFAAVLPTLASAWCTVERESAAGFEHRAPAARRGGTKAAASIWGADDEEEECGGGGGILEDAAAPDNVAPPIIVDEDQYQNEDIILLPLLPLLPTCAAAAAAPIATKKRKRARRGEAAFADQDMMLAMAVEE
jgi:hypothetical protein